MRDNRFREGANLSVKIDQNINFYGLFKKKGDERN